MSRWLVVTALVFGCTCALAQRKVQSSGFSYVVDKVPAWVMASPRPAVAPWSGQSGLRILETDTQVSLSGSSPVRYARIKAIAREPEALRELAQVKIAFSPEYETLTIHEVAVIRAGKRLDRLAATKFELLQRESALETSVYAGIVTAFAALQDVRVDDIIEYAYSIRGANPVFNGKYSAHFLLGWSTPIDALRVRIEYPAKTPLYAKVLGVDRSPTLSAKGDKVALELVLGGLAPIRIEDRVPPWFPLLPEIQVSQFKDWSEVKRWAMTHYGTSRELSPELRKLAEEIRAKSKSPEETAANILSFVQDEIRYFSVPIGVSSHKPALPDVTFSRRYGDCKDKTMLTIALLEYLGIAAHPAIVSISRRQQVAESLPSPLVFDHLIAEVPVNGKTYWLDSTRTYQGRALAQRAVLRFGKALVIDGGDGELVDVAPDPDYREGVEATEHFIVKKYTGPIELTITTRATGSDAERIRARFASTPRDVLINEVDDDYRRRYPKLRRTAPLALIDDRERNELVITDSFEVSDLFTYQNARVEAKVAANRIAMPLRRPEVVSRVSPVALSFPLHVSQRFEFDLPVETGFTGRPPVRLAQPQYAFTYRSGQTGRTVHLEFELETRRDHVLPAELPDYVANTRKVFEELDRVMQFVAYNPKEVETLYRQAAVSAQRDLAPLPAWTRRSLLGALWTRIATEQAIGWGLLEGDALATAWAEIASQRDIAGERDKGLEAVNEAFKLNPDSVAAFRARGELLLNSWKFNDAAADLQTVATRRPDDYRLNLAIALYYQQKYPEALQALAQDARRTAGPDLTQRLLWTYLAAKRSGADAAATLARNGYRKSESEWPAPALAYLLGELPEEKLMSSAKSNSSEALQRLCQAWFFVGESKLLAGDGAGAQAAFEQALKTEIRPYREYIFSSYELSRLKLQLP